MILRVDKLITNETRKILVPKEYLIYNNITEFGIEWMNQGANVHDMSPSNNM